MRNNKTNLNEFLQPGTLMVSNPYYDTAYNMSNNNTSRLFFAVGEFCNNTDMYGGMVRVADIYGGVEMWISGAAIISADRFIDMVDNINARLDRDDRFVEAFNNSDDAKDYDDFAKILQSIHLTINQAKILNDCITNDEYHLPTSVTIGIFDEIEDDIKTVLSQIASIGSLTIHHLKFD